MAGLYAHNLFHGAHIWRWGDLGLSDTNVYRRCRGIIPNVDMEPTPPVAGYYLAHDKIILAIPIALLARQGIERGFLPFEKSFLVILWLLPLLFIDNTKLYHLPLTPPLLIILMIFCWKRMRLEKVADTGRHASA